MNSEKLLILGCGDLGRRLAGVLEGLPYQITGLRRHPPQSNDQNLTYRACDVGDIAALTEIVSEGFAVIVITMTPAERSEEGYVRAYVESCRNLLISLRTTGQSPRLLVFVSSSGVYGQDDGSWVDEDSPTQPESFSGRCLLEAERIIRTSAFAHCVLRLSGIYGPGRKRLIEQVREGRAALTGAYTNRIHADDCAAVLAHLIERHRDGHALAPIYLASDCAPAPMAEVVRWLAQQLDVAVPEEDPGATLDGRANKRCKNQLLLASGFVFRYPDYRSGYLSLLAELE